MSGIEDQGLRPANIEEPPEEDATTDASDGDDAPADDVEDVPAGGAGADSGAADTVRVDPDDESSIANVSKLNDEPGVGTRREE